MNKLDELKNKLYTTSDKLGKPIDPEILDTVVYLNFLGLRTVASCEGHLDHGLPTPWIDIESEEAEKLSIELKKVNQERDDPPGYADTRKPYYQKAKKLWNKRNEINAPLARKIIDLLDEFYQNHQSHADEGLIIHRLGFGFRLTNQGSIIEFHKDETEKADNLIRYQKEMKAFTEFLKSKVV